MKKNKNKKKFLIALLIVVGVIGITVGASYAFFTYAKGGTTENSIQSGTITFHYQEVSGIGNGISLSNALPIADEQGKSQNEEGKVFDFRITSKTPKKIAVPYEITARLVGDDIGDIVKVYLTRVRDGIEEEILLANYNSLTQSTNSLANNYTEKTLYTAIIPPSTNYNESYRLRIWVDSKADFSGIEKTKYYCDGNEVTKEGYHSCSGVKTTNIEMEYPYNNKKFSLTVNAYANGRVLESDTLYVASDVFYANSKSEKCTGSNQHAECAINELKEALK